ncbi:MAG: hypothetical protein IPG88_25280 [Gemmatimonadetes bacterium]|nr:hypothetical protein [Gemmatimonadota bacterium]
MPSTREVDGDGQRHGRRGWRHQEGRGDGGRHRRDLSIDDMASLAGAPGAAVLIASGA